MNKEGMDEAAGSAEKEFVENYDKWVKKDVLDWFYRWYLKAGYKRLGKIVIQYLKEIPKCKK